VPTAQQIIQRLSTENTANTTALNLTFNLEFLIFHAFNEGRRLSPEEHNILVTFFNAWRHDSRRDGAAPQKNTTVYLGKQREFYRLLKERHGKLFTTLRIFDAKNSNPLRAIAHGARQSFLGAGSGSLSKLESQKLRHMVEELKTVIDLLDQVRTQS
jgi:hypothetical protein